MLELPKLMDQVADMSQAIARQRADYAQKIAQARRALAQYAQVDQEALDEKIRTVKRSDPTWRGAWPCEDRLDARYTPAPADEDATLIAVDGSQIYPDRHGPALYYLINTGVILLRQGSGQAPWVSTHPQLFYQERDLYDDELNLRTAQDINDHRELEEMRELARWAARERAYLGEDRERLVLALTDGPLLTWVREERKGREQALGQARVQAYLRALADIQASGAIPIGYVARPRSANVLRLLHILQLPEDAITTQSVRNSRYRALTDTALFADLAPNQRTALFRSTALANEEDFARAGQTICFFYLNVSRDPQTPYIARVEIPRWAAQQPGLVDRVHRALVRDAEGANYPYVLIRAHELALVTHGERQELEAMLNIEVMQRTGEPLFASIKETLKASLG